VAELHSIVAVRRERALAGLRPLALSGQPLPPPDSPILVSVVRNEHNRLEDFLRHYRASGIRRFCFVDNLSTDGTQDLLAAQPDLDLLLTERTYGNPERQGWIVAALARYGGDRWILTADADELIVFDGIETHGFDALAREMDRRGIKRVRGIMLDMYAEGPLLESAYVPGERLVDAYPLFDASGYLEQEGGAQMSILGGPRRRAFGGLDPTFAPLLAKVPMCRVAPGEVQAHPHYRWPVQANFLAPRLLGILHFKFLPDFAAKIARAVREGNYAKGSAEYQVYQRACASNPRMTLKAGLSRTYEGSRSLVETGLIKPVGWDGAPVRAAPPDGGISRFSPEPMSASAVGLLRRVLRQASKCCVFGLGPQALLALRLGVPRLVAVEWDQALADAFLRRPIAEAAMREGRFMLLREMSGNGLEEAWRALGEDWPDLVIANGRHRLASALGAVLFAPPEKAPRVLFTGMGWMRPWYAPLNAFFDVENMSGPHALLRPRRDIDRAALAAAYAKHLPDPR